MISSSSICAEVGSCRVRPRLHVTPPAAEARPCGRCGTPSADLLYSGRWHLCEPCFDSHLAALRGLPANDPEAFDAYQARFHATGGATR